MNEVLQALQELVAEISQYRGHGNPGFPCRAGAYLAIQQAQEVLKKNNRPYKTLDEQEL